MVSILEKLSNVQIGLLKRDIPKSGHNAFNNFDYHELEDLLPPVVELSAKEGCTIYFSFSKEQGVLHFCDFSGGELCCVSPLPDIRELPRMNLIQSFGSYETYTKRYLLMNMFCISEHEVIDSINQEEFKTAKDIKKGSSKNSAPKKESAPKEVSNDTVIGWDKLTEYLQHKYPTAKSFDKSMYNTARFQLFKKGMISKEENDALYTYLEDLKE